MPSPSTSPTTTTGTEPGDQPAGGAPTVGVDDHHWCALDARGRIAVDHREQLHELTGMHRLDDHSNLRQRPRSSVSSGPDDAARPTVRRATRGGRRRPLGGLRRDGPHRPRRRAGAAGAAIARAVRSSDSRGDRSRRASRSTRSPCSASGRRSPGCRATGGAAAADRPRCTAAPTGGSRCRSPAPRTSSCCRPGSAPTTWRAAWRIGPRPRSSRRAPSSASRAPASARSTRPHRRSPPACWRPGAHARLARRRAGHRPLVAVGGTTVRPPAHDGRGADGQGREHRPA